MLWDITFTNHRKEEAVFSAYPYQDFAMRDVQKEVLFFHFCGNQMTGFYDKGVGALRLDYFAYEAIHKGYTLFNASKPFSSYEMSRDKFIGSCRAESSPEALDTGNSTTWRPPAQDSASADASALISDWRQAHRNASSSS